MCLLNWVPNLPSYFSEENVEVGEGVFLYLGYSKKEEDLLKPYTKKGIEDVVPIIEKLVRENSYNLNGVRNCMVNGFL